MHCEFLFTSERELASNVIWNLETSDLSWAWASDLSSILLLFVLNPTMRFLKKLRHCLLLEKNPHLVESRFQHTDEFAGSSQGSDSAEPDSHTSGTLCGDEGPGNFFQFSLQKLSIGVGFFSLRDYTFLHCQLIFSTKASAWRGKMMRTNTMSSDTLPELCHHLFFILSKQVHSKRESLPCWQNRAFFFVVAHCWQC